MEALNELDLFGARGGPASVIHVMPDEAAQCQVRKGILVKMTIGYFVMFHSSTGVQKKTPVIRLSQEYIAFIVSLKSSHQGKILWE